MGFDFAQGGSSRIYPRVRMPPCQGWPGYSWLDADAEIYVDAMVVEPDDDRKTAIDQLFLNLKGVGNHGSDDNYALMDQLVLHATHDPQASLLDLTRGNPFDATAVGAPTWTQDRGYTGATGKYINLNFSPSTDGANFTRNANSFGTYIRTDLKEDAYVMGSRNGGGIDCIIAIYRADDKDWWGNNVGAQESVASATSQGFYAADRSDSTTSKLYRNGSSLGTDITASSLLSAFPDMYTHCFNNNGTATLFTTRQLACTYAGGSLTGTRHGNFNGAIETYMDAIGAGVQS